MKRFTDLNSFGNTSVDIQDLRPSGIRYDTRVPFQIANDTRAIVSRVILTKPAIDITEIINYSTANVQYEIKIVNVGTPALTGATISWADFPSTCTLTSSTNYYLVTNITDPAEWDKLGAFILNLPADFETAISWYVQAKVIYNEAGVEKTISWRVYDPNRYFTSEMIAQFGLNANIGYRTNGASAMSASATCSASATVIKPSLRLQVDENPSTGQLFEATYVSDSAINVYWGDGTNNTYPSGSGTMSHTYTGTGSQPIVNINGLVRKYTQASPAGRVDVIAIKDWNNSLQDLSSAFVDHNITEVPNYLPNTVTNISYMLKNNYSFNDSRITSWDTSNVTNIEGLFQGCVSFNQPIGTWDVSGVTNLDNLFRGSSMTFNQSLNAWDVSGVTSMKYTFYGCINYNQSLSTWNTTNVTDMSWMFGGCTNFNQNINAWNVGNVTNMTYMFFGAAAYNQSLSSWNVGNVTNMSAMFAGASTFNQDLNLWDVSKVTNFSGMFSQAAAFNGPIISWNTGAATNMSTMFEGCTSFNRPINSWNTSNVTNMLGMFIDAGVFNQDISGWDTSKVTNMSSMFRNAAAFNQDLSGWCVSLIPTKPTLFDYGATSWTLPKPVWGTCP